jgi:hypothetical protein
MAYGWSQGAIRHKPTEASATKHMKLFQQPANALDWLLLLAVERGLGRYLHQFDDVAIRVGDKGDLLAGAPCERSAIRFYVHRSEVFERCT